MQKKKGFTLIELLAVILILGIIALIAIPTVTNIIKESKRGAFKASVQNIIGAVETECQLEQMKGEELTTSYTFTNGSIDNELNIKGDLPKSGTITVDSSCNVAVDVTDGTFTATKSAESDEIEIGEDGEESEEFAYTCIRATTLHTEVCNNDDEDLMIDEKVGCGAVYTLGEAIEYGNLGTAGTLSSGDAFDCDVNKDGTYDPATERFYYVSDYYNTTSQEFESDKATLIYYNNTIGGIASASKTGTIAYDAEGKNYVGPVSAVVNLPTREKWSNKNLITGKRAIVGEEGQTSVVEFSRDPWGPTGNNFDLPTAFDYSNYAARFLTTQELAVGCNISTIGSGELGELDGCVYLLENTDYADATENVEGYLFETPEAGKSYSVWALLGSYRVIQTDYMTYYNGVYYGYGVRPVISVLKSNISY